MNADKIFKKIDLRSSAFICVKKIIA